MPLQEISNRILHFPELKQNQLCSSVDSSSEVPSSAASMTQAVPRLLRPFYRCHQTFNEGAGKCHFKYSIFSSRTRPYFIFLGRSGKTPPQSCGRSCQSTALLNSLPGTPYYHRTGTPGSFSGENPNSLLKLSYKALTNSNSFRRPHLRAARSRVTLNLVFRCRHRLFRK